MKYSRIKGDASDYKDKTKVEQAIRADPVLTALYKNDYVDVDSAVAAGVDNVAFKLAMLRLAWILIRRITR